MDSVYLVAASVTFESENGTCQVIKLRGKVYFLQYVMRKGNVQCQDGLQCGCAITETNFSVIYVLLKRWQITTGNPLCFLHKRINISLPLHRHEQRKLTNHPVMKYGYVKEIYV